MTCQAQHCLANAKHSIAYAAYMGCARRWLGWARLGAWVAWHGAHAHMRNKNGQHAKEVDWLCGWGGGGSRKGQTGQEQPLATGLHWLCASWMDDGEKDRLSVLIADLQRVLCASQFCHFHRHHHRHRSTAADVAATGARRKPCLRLCADRKGVWADTCSQSRRFDWSSHSTARGSDQERSTFSCHIARPCCAYKRDEPTVRPHQRRHWHEPLGAVHNANAVKERYSMYTSVFECDYGWPETDSPQPRQTSVSWSPPSHHGRLHSAHRVRPQDTPCRR